MISDPIFGQRSHNDQRVDAVMYAVTGGITQQEIDALHAAHPGYTGVLEHYITLYKPVQDAATVAAEKDAVIARISDERDEYAARLVSPPAQGEAWDAAKRYIRGDEVTHGGIAYISQRFNRGKQPDNHTDAWLPKPVALVITRWEDDPSAFQYQVDDLRSFDLDGDPVQRSNWRCKKAHTKSNIRKPMTVSDFWESYIAQGGITTWNPRRIL